MSDYRRTSLNAPPPSAYPVKVHHSYLRNFLLGPALPVLPHKPAYCPDGLVIFCFYESVLVFILRLWRGYASPGGDPAALSDLWAVPAPLQCTWKLEKRLSMPFRLLCPPPPPSFPPCSLLPLSGPCLSVASGELWIQWRTCYMREEVGALYWTSYRNELMWCVVNYTEVAANTGAIYTWTRHSGECAHVCTW